VAFPCGMCPIAISLVVNSESSGAVRVSQNATIEVGETRQLVVFCLKVQTFESPVHRSPKPFSRK
jgi:hypothetical protein